jgi:subtilisin family serine protease
VTRRRLLAAGVVVAALVAGGFGVGQAAEPATAAGQNPVLPAGRTYTVTLLTGDVVTVHTRQSGCPGVEVRPAKPDGDYRTSCGPDGHLRVIPGSAVPLVGRVLDDDLFDVTTLIEEGYDDASSADLPLIVRAGQARGIAPRLANQRVLPSIGAVAGRQPKSGAAGFVATLTNARIAAGDTHVWLDRRMRATQETDTKNRLDANLRQVAAPQAWAAGHTGEGVRVAVLDTGADPTHPDLAGKIVEKADFTVEGGDAVDHFGHGTHVAATIAGTGAGSDGARRGVAPDAQLVIGKVLGDQGGGTESGVIAGMEWAASRATVVNMSLGGGPTDGRDPVTMALQQLTEQYGTLFVTSAGNDGPSESTVGSPAVAPDALAVGAVDAKDQLAEFSSRGPALGSRALKPEIVAPGVDIVAARAAGTTLGEPVDAKYTRLSGTSMAAPHVAGAAAVLAQVHPDWDARRLKAALVGAADPVTGGDPYEVGAGRLDVAKAVGDVVSGTVPVDLGTFAYPQTGTAEAKVGWTNTGDKATRLTLDVRVTDRYGKTTANPAVTLAATTVTVPAGGGASAVVRLDRARLGATPGYYTAVVTARWPGGSATTPVAFYVEPPSHDVTITAEPAKNPENSEVWTSVDVANLDDPALFYSSEIIEPGGVLRLRVPAGRYSIMGNLQEIGPSPEDPGSVATLRLTLTGDPDVAVSSDLTMNLGTSTAKQVTASVDGKDTGTSYSGVAFLQHPRRGSYWGQLVYAIGDIARKNRLYVTPTDGVGIGSFQGYEGFTLDAADRSTRYDLIRPVPGRLPADPVYRVTAAEHARLARIDQRFAVADVPGATISHRRIGEVDDGLILVDVDYATDLPRTRVDYVSPEGVWTDSAGTDVYFAAFVEPRQRYAAGSRQEKVWARQPLRPDWFGDGTSPSYCTPQPVRRTSTLLRVTLVEFTDQHDRFTCLDDTWPDEWIANTTRSMSLYRNGTLVDSHPSSRAEFPMSKEKATYRLTYDLDATAALPVSTKVSTAWTFRSAGPSGTGDAAVPLLSVDYALPLDRNNHPTTGDAGFTVHQSPGTATQKVTTFEAWTSTDDGTTWTPVTVRKVAGNRFSAALPEGGQAVSLRVAVAADGGSALEQTIIRAYGAA